jgi:hypothetical protein
MVFSLAVKVRSSATAPEVHRDSWLPVPVSTIVAEIAAGGNARGL